MEPATHFSVTRWLSAIALLWLFVGWAGASDIRVPPAVEAGRAFSISVGGSGRGTLYLIGPDHVAKRTVDLGSSVEIESADVRSAGVYRVIVCDRSCTSTSFEVKATQPAHLDFFLHPSRVPVSSAGSIDATAFLFDQYFNLVLSPATVDFRVTPANGAGYDHRANAQHGVAWTRMDSTALEGAVHVKAIAGAVEEPSVIQQVASEACSLRVKALETGRTVTLETEPVRDCSGNPLPDGTIVSFTKVDQAGRSTVDTPIKKGVARTQFTLAGPAHVSVACGVVLGNELALNGKS